jgi:hypothetical protein
MQIKKIHKLNRVCFINKSIILSFIDEIKKINQHFFFKKKKYFFMVDK